MYLNDLQYIVLHLFLEKKKKNWKKGMTFPLPLYDLPLSELPPHGAPAFLCSKSLRLKISGTSSSDGSESEATNCVHLPEYLPLTLS